MVLHKTWVSQKNLSYLTHLAVSLASLLAVTCVSQSQIFSQSCLRVSICLEGKAEKVLKSDLLACLHKWCLNVIEWSANVPNLHLKHFEVSVCNLRSQTVKWAWKMYLPFWTLQWMPSLTPKQTLMIWYTIITAIPCVHCWLRSIWKSL